MGETETPNTQGYKEYPQRYWTLLGYFLISSSYSLSTTTFSSISAIVSDIYNIQPVWVNMNSLIFNFLHLPLSFPVGYFLEKFGLQQNMRFAALLSVIGAWLRIFMNDNFFLSTAGCIVFGIGNPIIQNCITKLSVVWFKAEKREQVTRFLMIALLVTMMGGSVMSGLWLADYNEFTDKDTGYSEGKDLVQSLMLVQAYLISGMSLIGVLMFFKQPASAPSFTATQKREESSKSIKSLFTNKSYIFTLLSFSLFLGAFLSIGTILSFILKPFGFGPESVSYTGIGQMVFGIIGNQVGAYLFKRSPRYKAFIIFGILGSVVGIIVIMPILSTGNTYILIIPFIIIGAVSIQSFPVYIELASECAYPVAESFSAGFLQGSAQMVGFMIGSIQSLFLDGNEKDPVYYVLVSSIAIFFLCLFFAVTMKVQLNRKRLDAKHQKDLVIIDENNRKEGIQDSLILSYDQSCISSDSSTI